MAHAVALCAPALCLGHQGKCGGGGGIRNGGQTGEGKRDVWVRSTAGTGETDGLLPCPERVAANGPPLRRRLSRGCVAVVKHGGVECPCATAQP